MSGFSDLGGAVGDIFGFFGGESASDAYDKAAQISENSAKITERSTQIQTAQQQREAYGVIGGQAADVASAGFAQSGSALDLLRSSAQQSALSKQLIQNQGELNKQGFLEQAESYKGQAQSAEMAAEGSGISGIMGIASAVLSFL